MPFRPRIVKGGYNESVTCACTAQVPGYEKHPSVTCQCTEQKFYLGNAPDRWICDDCAKGKHKIFG